MDIALLALTDPVTPELFSAGGSTGMPHKQNPVLAEPHFAPARRNAANLSSMHHAWQHQQDRSGAAWMLA